MMKKAVTLTELIVAIVLLGVIILGVSSFHLASDAFLRSSETKVEVINDLTFVLEHLHKNILQAKGSVSSPGMQATNLGGGRIRLWLNQDAGAVEYIFDSVAHEITFDDGLGPPAVISSRLIEFPGSPLSITAGLAANGGVRIDNLAFAFDADDFDPANRDPRNNPIATTVDAGGSPTVHFFPWSHSWS